jgi:hypothetical protein
LVADLRRGRDSDFVDALRREFGMAAQQVSDHRDDQVIGAGLGVDALRAGLAERRASTVYEDNVVRGERHGALLE